MQAIIILTTVASEKEANKIARYLIERRQAACVNIINDLQSIFRWEGKITEEKEFLLIIKTLSTNEEIVYNTIKQIHSYDTPEIVTLPTTQVDQKYFDWMIASVAD
jgi:periplasmic divalent cation tolerance protein